MQSKLITDLYFSDSPISAPHERHKHNVHQMLCVLEGSLSIEIAGKKIECSAPALVFIGNYEPHIISATSERYVRYVLTLDPYQANAQIKPELLTSVFSYHPEGFCHMLDIAPIKNDVTVLMESLLCECNLPDEEKTAGGEALLLSALLYRIKQFSPSHFAGKKYGSAEITVTSVRRELESNFASKLELDALAARHHVSRYYLAHIFKEVTGYSLKEYLMLCRMSYACQQLSNSDLPIGEIADASGFRDMSNFSRSFKKTIGISPSEFRKKTVN